MPPRISLLPQSLYGLSHDPTQTLQGNPLSFIGDNPYAAMIEEIIFGAIKNTLRMFAQFAHSFPIFGDLIAPFLDALVDLADDIPETMVEFLTDPIAWMIRILGFFVTFARGIPLFGDLIAPFLDAIEALIGGDTATMMDFLTNPIAWAKRILRFCLEFLRGVPVLGDLIAPFLDAIEDLLDDIPDTLLDFLNPFTWMPWIANGFLDQFGLDFGFLSGLTGTDAGSGTNFFSGVIAALGNPTGLLAGLPVFGALGTIPVLSPLLSGLLIDPSSIIGILGQGNVNNLVTDLADRLFSSVFDDLRNRLWQRFLGTTSATGKDNLDVEDALISFFSGVTDSTAAWSSLTSRTTRLTQTMQILRGDVITAADSFVQGMKNWFDAQSWFSWTHT
jgi:hypothetical protein